MSTARSIDFIDKKVLCVNYWRFCVYVACWFIRAFNLTCEGKNSAFKKRFEWNASSYCFWRWPPTRNCTYSNHLQHTHTYEDSTHSLTEAILARFQSHSDRGVIALQINSLSLCFSPICIKSVKGKHSICQRTMHDEATRTSSIQTMAQWLRDSEIQRFWDYVRLAIVPWSCFVSQRDFWLPIEWLCLHRLWDIMTFD